MIRLVALLLVWTMVVAVYVAPTVRMQEQPILGESTDAERLVDQVRGADRIVLGTVTSITSRYASTELGDHVIISTVVIDVDENMKGRRGDTVTVQMVGGTVGGVAMGSSDQEIVPIVGDNVIAMAARNFVVPHGIIKLTAAGELSEGYATATQIRAAIRGEVE
jgi:hypothetical protein